MRAEHHPLYSVYFAPRGYVRIMQMGMAISHQHLTPFDRLIGMIGEAGSGKSLLTKGMFPGLELTNDDNGINVRPLPILDIDQSGFYQQHTFHMDIRFESAFTQMHALADAIRQALSLGKRVIVEHFDLVYPLLGLNAELLVGIGEEIIVARPTIFGPEPADIAEIVFQSNRYRRMAHTAEDLTERYLREKQISEYSHGDVRHGFLLRFREPPGIDVEEMETYVLDLIKKDIPVSYADEQHIYIGDMRHKCTGPRMHVASTGQIENFHFLEGMLFDELSGNHLLVGLLGTEGIDNVRDLNRIITH